MGLYIKISSYNNVKFSNQAKPSSNPLLASIKANIKIDSNSDIKFKNSSTNFAPSKNFYDLITEDYFNENNYEEKVAKKIELDSTRHPYFEHNVNILNIQNEVKNSVERANILLNQLNQNTNSLNQGNLVRELLLEFNDAFFVNIDIFSPTNVYQHKIRLKPNAEIIHVKQFRLPYAD